MNIYYELSKQYNLPVPVVELICRSPFRFAKNIMANKEFDKELMFAHLGKIRLKPRLRKLYEE